MQDLNEQIISCRRCARLLAHIDQVVPRKGLSAADYWGCAVPGFGDLQAQIGLVGLAPGAHGANRTGRPFTGDGAGDFMYPLLHEAGLASQPEAEHRGDGLSLNNLYITNAVKCLPPENKPNGDEFSACRPYLAEELARLEQLRVIVALGQGAFNSLLRLFKQQGVVSKLADYPFGHGVHYLLPNGLWLTACYHTSRYNVQTGRMTDGLFRAFLQQVQGLIRRENG